MRGIWPERHRLCVLRSEGRHRLCVEGKEALEEGLEPVNKGRELSLGAVLSAHGGGRVRTKSNDSDRQLVTVEEGG